MKCCNCMGISIDYCTCSQKFHTNEFASSSVYAINKHGSSSKRYEFVHPPVGEMKSNAACCCKILSAWSETRSGGVLLLQARPRTTVDCPSLHGRRCSLVVVAMVCGEGGRRCRLGAGARAPVTRWCGLPGRRRLSIVTRRTCTRGRCVRTGRIKGR